MDVHSKTSSLVLRSFLLLVVISAAAFLLLKASSSPTIAGTQERVFENTIPKDVPIKVKIKKEKEQSFKDLKNEKWLREFELEVTNTGDKPIYFLYLTLITDVTVGGEHLVFPLRYGRGELGAIATKPASDDIPIQPSGTHVFKIHPGQIPPWERKVSQRAFPDATKLQLKIEILSFGDGTGYFGNHEYPLRQTNGPTGRLNRSAGNAFRLPPGREGPSDRRRRFDEKPVPTVPVNFLSSTPYF
ncbi:MAG TPA: hypothetical protein DC047_00170 [Blastocatellia bacterium]|nr:hypothetical protein [Blastocatellia bacterium]